MAALLATFAAVVTSLIAVFCFSGSPPDIYSDHLVAAAARGAISQHDGFNASDKGVDGIMEGEAALPTAPFDASMLMPNAMSDRGLKDDSDPANIAWLMSFPNR
jgi:hypothetical protein